MFQKAIKKSIPFLITCVLAICPLSLNANAATTLAYRFQTDLSNIGIYYSNTYATYHGEYTMRAAHQWRNDSRLSFIYPNRVTNSANSDVYCQMYSNSASSVLAETSFYYGTTQISPYNHNWDNCKIKVNHAKTVSLETLTHEFGHVLGLDDNNSDITSIMCQTAYGRTATKPSYADCTLVFKKYSPYIG